MKISKKEKYHMSDDDEILLGLIIFRSCMSKMKCVQNLSEKACLKTQKIEEQCQSRHIVKLDKDFHNIKMSKKHNKASIVLAIFIRSIKVYITFM